jgi:hypothetical protein
LKTILLITPHYPPSNLAAVHRSRLFAQHLPALGWKPIILTVHEDYYEESLDWKLHQLLPKDQRIEKVSAFKVTKPRLIGDIGLRGYFQLRRRALELIRSEKIDFVYIPIPSFYMALLGPYLFKKTGVPYGIDYIDPWVHQFPGSEKIYSRHWFTTQLAKFLEPIAVKHASLITGVSEGYYKPVLERNPHLINQAISVAMPYGGEKSDHDFVSNVFLSDRVKENLTIPQKKANTFRFVYAGAMLPKAHKPLTEIFRSLQKNDAIINFPKPEFHFIGTLGTIKPIAQRFGLWQTCVFEYSARIPYLEVLKNLDATDGVFILGSTEPHYTPSKVYQGVLSKKPILAVLHKESTAVKVLNESKAGRCVLMDGEKDLDTLGEKFIDHLYDYIPWAIDFDPNSVNKEIFDQYSAKAVTGILVNALSKI